MIQLIFKIPPHVLYCFEFSDVRYILIMPFVIENIECICKGSYLQITLQHWLCWVLVILEGRLKRKKKWKKRRIIDIQIYLKRMSVDFCSFYLCQWVNKNNIWTITNSCLSQCTLLMQSMQPSSLRKHWDLLCLGKNQILDLGVSNSYKKLKYIVICIPLDAWVWGRTWHSASLTSFRRHGAACLFKAWEEKKISEIIFLGRK